jgi:hypothetical protein
VGEGAQSPGVRCFPCARVWSVRGCMHHCDIFVIYIDVLAMEIDASQGTVRVYIVR